ESSTGELRLQPIIANYAGTTTLLGDNVTLYSGTHNFATGSVVDGQLNLQSGATANFIGTTQTNGAFNNASNSLLTINGGTLTLNGGMNWGGSGNIVGVGASPRLSVAAGQTLNVSAAGAKSITGAALVLDNAVLQTGGATALTVGGAATVLGSSTVTTGTGSVTFGSTVDGPGSLSATSSGAGFVAFSGAIGSTTPLNNLSVTSDQPVTLPQTTLSGDLAITAAGQIGQSGPLSVGGTSSFNAGTQPIDLSLAGNDFQGAVSVPGASSVSLFDQNALALGSISASGVITAQATTDLSIGAGATIATPAAGNSIVLVAGGDFVNSAGAGALSAPSGRWLVYSTSPGGSTEGGLAGAAGSAQPRIYNRNFAANPPATIAEPGSHLVYSVQPSVTVTANNASRPYGDPNPAFSASFSGFVNDDGVLDSAASAGISGAPAFVAPGGNLTVAGSPYAITPGLGTLASSNGYAFAFVDGQLTVTQRPVTVTADAGQSKVYGNADPGAYTFANTSLGTGVALVGALDRGAGENVGNYAIGQGTLTNAGNPNYLITYVGDNFGITQRPVTVTADPGQSKLFGSPDPVFSFTNTSLGSGVALAGALSRTPGESGGSYPILEGTLTNANNPNYLLTYVGDSFTIVGGPPPVVASSDISERMRVAIVDADQRHRDRRGGEDKAGRQSVFRLEDGGIKLPEGER
ncbi:MAG: hypothetical protein IT513_02395, partial [Burkholderiales bacterium]|nr:hypothetical protein [Burkholderiales bacterium]